MNYKKIYLPDFPQQSNWTAETGPDYSDGSDAQGFLGGDRRHGIRPTTIESALNYLAEFIPEGFDRRTKIDGIYSMLGLPH